MTDFQIFEFAPWIAPLAFIAFMCGGGYLMRSKPKRMPKAICGIAVITIAQMLFICSAIAWSNKKTNNSSTYSTLLAGTVSEYFCWPNIIIGVPFVINGIIGWRQNL